jgi:TolB-like protein
LESQCNPGQILVSRTVSEQVSTQLASITKAAGTRTLKNIASDFEVFTVETNAGSQPAARVDTAATSPEVTSQTKPCLAILPFDNLNKNEDSSFLTDGIFEDVTTELAMVRQLSVISRQSSINFGASGADIEQLIQQFNVDYMINGSVRSAGKKVRVSITLSAAQNSEILWSKRFDRVLDDIFEVQDEIVRSVVNQILGEIEVSSLERAKRKPTENMNSYEFLLRGKELHHQFERAANAEALLMFEAAIKSDPQNAQAYAWKACTLGQAMARGFSDTPSDELFPTAMELVNTAIKMDPNDFECHRLLSAVHGAMGDMKLSVEHGKRAYEQVPNDPRILQQYGEALLKSGTDVSLGCELTLMALEIDPVPQGQINSDKRKSDAAFACFLDEKYEHCIQLASEISNLAPITWLLAVSSQLALGQEPAANRFNTQDLTSYKSVDFSEEINKCKLEDRVIVGQLREIYSTKIKDILNA